ncbi:MAG: hypothetical protein LBE91_07480 [Tannerella sp.]|nr:hypothetical protein [Tannerella sp.]
MNGDTEFKQAIFGYLGKIKMSGFTDTLNLFYINSLILPQGTVIKDSNAVIMQDFVQKLNPATFKSKGGNLGISDIANVIKTVLSETQQNEIAILVTDGIFSPGKANAADYLSIQQTGIAVSVDEYLDKYPNTAVIVYQLSSNFKGIFYNKADAKISINEQRPYYMYIFGDAKYLSDLRKKAPDNDFKGGGIKNVFSIVSGSQPVKYFINPSIGKFKKSKKETKTTIEDLKKDSHTGKVKFAVNVDFSGLLLDEDYLLNSNNYENNSKYDLEIKPSTTKGKGYTHTLNFSSDKVSKGDVVVRLKIVLPAWVGDANDDDGSTASEGKTYGIKYQIDGIFDAFTFDNKYYTEIKINIK